MISNVDMENIEWSDRVAPVPSPSWWASDSELRRGNSAKHGPVLLKTLSRHAWSWRNKENVIAAATAAGEIGVGPKVLAADSELGLILMEQLGAEWRVGRLGLFKDETFRRNLIQARSRFAELEVSLSPRSPLNDLNHLVDECKDRGIDLDLRIVNLINYVNKFHDQLLDVRKDLELKPSQGEGTISNIMVNEKNEVKLIGWGSAAKLSSVHDNGVLIAEACPGALDIDEFIAELDPEADSIRRSATKLIAAIEHLRWAVLTSLRSVVDPDEDLDSIKYALWRMTFAELLLNNDDVRSELEGNLP